MVPPSLPDTKPAAKTNSTPSDDVPLSESDKIMKSVMDAALNLPMEAKAAYSEAVHEAPELVRTWAADHGWQIAHASRIGRLTLIGPRWIDRVERYPVEARLVLAGRSYRGCGQWLQGDGSAP